jgi:hypothetical protein
MASKKNLLALALGLAVAASMPAMAAGKNTNAQGNCGVGSGAGAASCNNKETGNGQQGGTGGTTGGTGATGSPPPATPPSRHVVSRSSAGAHAASVATGGNAASRSQAAAQGGNAAATGGQAIGGVATANGGAGGAATVSGNTGVGSVSVPVGISNPRPPVSNAPVATMVPTASCSKGTSVSASGITAAFGFAHADIDPDCAVQEEAKTVAQLGDPHTAREHLCHLERYRKTREAMGQRCLDAFYPTAYTQPKVGTMNATGQLVQ